MDIKSARKSKKILLKYLYKQLIFKNAMKTGKLGGELSLPQPTAGEGIYVGLIF